MKILGRIGESSKTESVLCPETRCQDENQQEGHATREADHAAAGVQVHRQAVLHAVRSVLCLLAYGKFQLFFRLLTRARVSLTQQKIAILRVSFF